ncbi:MAG: sporulation protein YunB [Peptococcaceae bacterium]|nr:sporulation protein YunB [Peptococcaceae bacterium]
MGRLFRPRYGRTPFRIPKIPKSILIPGLLLVLFIYLFSVVERNLEPTIIAISEARANLIATEAINKAIYEKVLDDIDYNDLIYIHKDTQQRITMMQANSIKISRLVAQANLEIKDTLKKLNGEVFQIPLGQTLGSQLLANYGPRINVKIVPVGAVNIKIVDDFQQAGINQVRHILYINVETNVKIVVPLVTKSVAVQTQIPIAETIIVGQVPSTYFGMDTNLIKGLTNNK